MTNSSILESFLIYGKPNCTYCDQAKSLLDSQGIPYTYVDIVEQNLVEWIKGQGFRTVPVIYYNDSYVGGFNELKSFLVNKTLI
jgi:glutaredoxin